MKYCLLLIIFLTTFNLTAQTDPQSPDLKEAEQLSAQVVKLYKSGKVDEALPLAERALALRQKALGSDNALVAGALRNLVEVQLAKKKTKEAEVTYDKYLSVLEKAPDKYDSNFVNVLDRYVCLLINNKDHAKALEIQRRLYKLDNKFAYEDTVEAPAKSVVSPSLIAGKLISMSKPAYLAEAKIDRISGPVVFKVTIDEKGKVIEANTVCGHPLLVKGAVTSIRDAQYEPTIISGQPVKVKGFVILNFVL